MGPLPPPDDDGSSSAAASAVIAAIRSTQEHNARLLSLLSEEICGGKGVQNFNRRPPPPLTPAEAKILESLLKNHSQLPPSLGCGSSSSTEYSSPLFKGFPPSSASDSIFGASPHTPAASNANSFTHPREELVRVMSRIYSRTLTTSSGGNCSVRDLNGTVWVTPKGNDKGALKRDEIAWRDPKSKEWKGNYPPSSEWPFHTAIFEKRPDVGAVLHAHSHTLVAFSVAKELPNTMSLSHAAALCGPVALAPYAVPGTDALADSIVAQVGRSDCVVMENHGIVVVAPTMLQAFHKFEALEFCARSELGAATLGGRRLVLQPSDLEAQFRSRTLPIDATYSSSPSSLAPPRPEVTPQECDLREAIVKYARRSYDQGLIHATSGALSARLGPSTFLITATGVDRHLLEPADIVLVDFSASLSSPCSTPRFYAERPGRKPSRAWAVHRAVYEAFPDIKSVVHAHPIRITSFCLSTVPFTPNVIPESYIVLRNVLRIPFRHSFDPEQVVAAFRRDPEACNILLAENDGVIIRGASLEQVFDRLEVLEATATVVLEAKAIGRVNLMTEEQEDEVDAMFFGAKSTRQRASKRPKLFHEADGCGPRQDEQFGNASSFNVFKGMRHVGPLIGSKPFPSPSQKRRDPANGQTERFDSPGSFNVFRGSRQVGPLIQYKVIPRPPPPKPRAQSERMDNSAQFNVYRGPRQVGPLLQHKIIPTSPPPKPRVQSERLDNATQFNVYKGPRQVGPLLQHKAFAAPADPPRPAPPPRADPPPPLQTEGMGNPSRFNVYQSPRRSTAGPLMQHKAIPRPPPPPPPPRTETATTVAQGAPSPFNIFRGSRQVGPLMRHKG